MVGEILPFLRFLSRPRLLWLSSGQLSTGTAATVLGGCLRTGCPKSKLTLFADSEFRGAAEAQNSTYKERSFELLSFPGFW